MYSSCVQSTMLHASETWPLTKPNLQCVQQNDSAMIRQICNVKPQDIVTTISSELLARLGIEDLDLILKERRLSSYGHDGLKERRLSWYGLQLCSQDSFDLQADDKIGPGRPKMAWKWLTERDCREWKLLAAIDPHDRHTWRSGVREGGPADVDIAPVPACNQKSDDDDDGKCPKFWTLYSILFWPKLCFLCTCCLKYLVEWQIV